MLLNSPSGAVAQLGERVVRNDEATGSIPVSSTNIAWRFLVAARNAGQQLLRRGATASGKFFRATLFQAKGVNYDS
jgi:hypothetical protein